MTGDNKTVINNWTGGGTLQTWTDGEWQILYAKDSAGNVVTLSLTSQDAVRLAYAVSPIPQEQFDRMRAANAAVYELSYPEARADELRQIADEIECDGGCEGCGPQKQERGEFCGFIAADNLRKLASALDVKATIDAALSPKIAAAETSPGDVVAVLRSIRAMCDEPLSYGRSNLADRIAAAIDRLDVKAEAKSQEPDAVQAVSYKDDHARLTAIWKMVDPYASKDIDYSVRSDDIVTMVAKALYTHHTTKPPAVSVDAIKAALTPFAKEADVFDRTPGIIVTHDDVELWQPGGARRTKLTVGDLRRARSAIAALIAGER